MSSEVGEAAKTLGEVARVWVGEPGKLVAAQGDLFQSYADLWGRSFRRFLGEEVEPVAEPEPGDNRFKDPEWSANPYFDFWKQAYLVTARWAEQMLDKTDGLDERTRQTIEHGRRIRAVLSQPENAPLTLAEQAALLLAVEENLLNALPLPAVATLQIDLAASLAKDLPGVTDRINRTGSMDDKDRAALHAYVKNLLAALAPAAAEKDSDDGATRSA